MKKLLTCIMVLVLLATAMIVPAAGEEAAAGNPPPEQMKGKCGLLTMLNISEEAYAQYVSLRRMVGGILMRLGYGEAVTQPGPADGENPPPPAQGAAPEGDNPPPPAQGTAAEGENPPPPSEDGASPEPPEGPESEIIFYDSLDAMLMALNAGDIQSMEIYQSVGEYLCAMNDNLTLGMKYDLNRERNRFARNAFSLITGNDFAFLMMEENKELRDQFSAAITAMKEDGTLDRLIQEQITDVIEGKTAEAIELPVKEGAKTVKVAVTGALPPMDYVAADGTPAGFNTAVLAEIGNRAGINMELVVVDSIGRAAALASGTADAVFWTRTSAESSYLESLSEEERNAKKAEMDAEQTEEEVRASEKLAEVLGADEIGYGNADMPEGTIVTAPYYFDVFVPVELKKNP